MTYAANLEPPCPLKGFTSRSLGGNPARLHVRRGSGLFQHFLPARLTRSDLDLQNRVHCLVQGKMLIKANKDKSGKTATRIGNGFWLQL